ncbi:AGAP012180-PA [Anopheles gambiae str. PEST]|uniref:Transmembrane protein 234 homolog n=1 Tax=Anopheles gambiae TaxID=7165 RepID=TM234_ANOGA|nr:transmembrane protein 234 homolog [Anopheles gambiae]XP_040238434.2 transmembrane protein 234 homolog isoform X1 [Anopheles coluzzii]A0NGI1.1 RecName: Full=Transmembrane protein 234 homolog [Anopheles gambiae]EAU75803.1 AGAP012180-PA [Anopheles gambiae str. PEST]
MDSPENTVPASVDIYAVLSILLVAIMWGATNPFIKRGSIGYNELKADSKLGQLWLEVRFLITRWQYLLPLVINQLGSIVYVLTLQRTELSLTVPMANSLTFVFTAITARLLGERQSGWKIYCGMTLVILGTVICGLDKML